MRASLKDQRLLLLLAITAAGIALRFVNIDRWPLWGDEAMTLLIAQYPLKTLFVQPVDPTPGLYYALHKLLLGPFVDAGQARYIALVCGTLLIPAAYWLAKEAKVPALLTAALVALSFPLIDYSQEARAYALLILLICFSAIFFIRWSRARRLPDLLLTLTFCLFAFYTHPVSVFWIGPIAISILWMGRRQSLLPLVLAAVLAVPELLRIGRYPDDGFVWLTQATPAQAADTIARAILPFRPGYPWLAVALAVATWRLWVHRRGLLEWSSANPAAAVVLATLLAEPLLIWLFGLVTTPIFMTRTILPAVPAFMLAMALLMRFEQRLARFAVVSLYAASIAVTGTTRAKEQWDVIAKRVGDDKVLLCQPWKAAAMGHARGSGEPLLLRYDNGVAELGGSPWAVVFYDSLTSKRRMAEAHRRAARLDARLYPVWPVRSGLASELPPAPTTLMEARQSCAAYVAGFKPYYGWPNN